MSLAYCNLLRTPWDLFRVDLPHCGHGKTSSSMSLSVCRRTEAATHQIWGHSLPSCGTTRSIYKSCNDETHWTKSLTCIHFFQLFFRSFSHSFFPLLLALFSVPRGAWEGFYMPHSVASFCSPIRWRWRWSHPGLDERGGYRQPALSALSRFLCKSD